MAFLQTWNIVCWGKMALWGKMERGKMAPFHLTPKGVSFCPNALVRFTPRPFHIRKFKWRKWLNGSRKRKLTHCDRWLHVVKYNYVPLVSIFTSFDCATGDIIVDIMAFLLTWNMVCWGKMALWGKMERGKMAPFHLTPKGVSFCPNALVRFTPHPFHIRKFKWRKWLNVSRKRKLTHCDRVANTNLSHHWFR